MEGPELDSEPNTNLGQAEAREREQLSQPQINWGSFLEQIRRDYETPPALGIAHGLQKDAIQNGWGARMKDRNWSFSFRLTRDLGNKLMLTMTDEGATGLTGRVFDYAETRAQLPDTFPPDEKLARFECMFDSGGGQGPGLFGRGKLVFNAASQEHLIYYDSLTMDGQYRLGKRQIIGRRCEQLQRILEGDVAHQRLKEWTSGVLQPLDRSGTRITIVEPIPEITNAIREGTFLQAIEETWWEIIQKYDAKITVTNEDGSIFQAHLPKEFGSLPKKDDGGWRAYYRANEPVQIGDSSFLIKHLHFLLPQSGHVLREELRGVCVQRRGMKVGILSLSGIPDEISDRFFGYIQLNPDFEDLLAETENTTHYGFAFRNKPVYRNLRKTVQDHLDLFMQDLGYRKAGDPGERTRRILEEASADLNSILSSMGVPGFGTGRERGPGVFLSVKGLDFPGGTNYLSVGAEIAGFSYLVKNTTNRAQSPYIEVYTFERDTGRIETLLHKTRLDIQSRDSFETSKQRILVRGGIYPRGKKVGCTARLLDEEDNVLSRKTFFFYVDMSEQPPPAELATIILQSAEWPRRNSRRVDYGQAIRNLTYEVENHSAQKMWMKLKVRTLWATEREPIDNIAEQDIELGPFESTLFNVPQISVTEEKFREVRRGKILLRCHAVALQTTKDWEKGTRLAEHNVAFYLNMDPSYGFFDDQTTFQGGPEKPRSEAQPLVSDVRLWQLRINTTHPAYEALSDEVQQKNYVFEEMARQTVYVLLRKNQYELIRKLGGLQAEEFDDPEAVLQVAYLVTDKILANYY